MKMIVPEFEESAEMLVDSDETPFESVEDVEEGVEKKREELMGAVKKKRVLAHLLVKEYGLTSMKTVDGKMEIDDLRENLSGVELNVYLLGSRKIERDDKDDFVVANISDRTGEIVAFIFDEELIDDFLDYDPSFGDCFSFKGYTRKREGRGLSYIVSDSVKEIDDMDSSVGDGIKIPMEGLDSLSEYDYFAIEGIVTELDTGHYNGCPECRTSLDEGETTCDNCNFAFEEQREYLTGSLTIMKPDGSQDAEISIPPRTNGVPDDIAQKPARVYGQKAFRKNDDGEKEVDYRLLDVEKVDLTSEDFGNEGEVETGEETEEDDTESELSENAEDFLSFVDGFGKVPASTAKDYCENKLGMDDEEIGEFVDGLLGSGEIDETYDEKYMISE